MASHIAALQIRAIPLVSLWFAPRTAGTKPFLIGLLLMQLSDATKHRLQALLHKFTSSPAEFCEMTDAAQNTHPRA
jgi:hypothetical protein